MAYKLISYKDKKLYNLLIKIQIHLDALFSIVPFSPYSFFNNININFALN